MLCLFYIMKHLQIAVRIIHYGLSRDDVLRPLCQAFEDDVKINEQATYEMYKKKNNKREYILLSSQLESIQGIRKRPTYRFEDTIVWDRWYF